MRRGSPWLLLALAGVLACTAACERGVRMKVQVQVRDAGAATSTIAGTPR